MRAGVSDRVRSRRILASDRAAARYARRMCVDDAGDAREPAFESDRDRMDRRPRRLLRHGRRPARRGEPAAPRHRRRLPSRARSGDARRVSTLPRRHRPRGAAVLGRAAIRGAAPAGGRPVVGRRDGVLPLAARRHRRRGRSTDRGRVGARRQGRSRRALSVGRPGARRACPTTSGGGSTAPRSSTCIRRPIRGASSASARTSTSGAPTGSTPTTTRCRRRVDPRGPEEGKRRASRGGSWRHDVKVTRCAARSSIPPRMRYADYGFRLRAPRIGDRLLMRGELARLPDGAVGAQVPRSEAACHRIPTAQHPRRLDHRLELPRRDLGVVHRPIREGPEPAVRVEPDPLRRVELERALDAPRDLVRALDRGRCAG